MKISSVIGAVLALEVTCHAHQTPPCCSSLSSELGLKVFYPDSPSYNLSQSGFWTLQATSDHPNCIIKPEDAYDVSTAVQILVANSCKFSVKGGGHTPWPGSASINNGITIDMSGIANVTVNAARTVASIGSGARWGPVYYALEAQGLMIAGGRDSAVGVGGLVVGGGYSWFTSTKGFVCDGVVNYELVTAKGTIINVNATSHKDLFLGLKGGSNNFGIVTRYDLKAFEFGKMWGGLRVYPNTTGHAQISAFVNFTKHAHTDTHANLINYWEYNNGTDIVFNVIDYTLPTPNPPIYDEISKIPGKIEDTTRIAELSSYTDELSSASQHNRNIFLTMTFTNNATMYKKAVEISNSYLKPLRSLPNFTWSLLFQPIPKIVPEVSLTTGGNLLGLSSKPKNLILYLLYVTWDDPAYDVELNASAYNCLHDIEAASKAMGTHSPFIYLNYAGQYQDPLGGYGETSVDIMKNLSKKYDSHGVFQNLVPGGYKIANARPATITN